MIRALLVAALLAGTLTGCADDGASAEETVLAAARTYVDAIAAGDLDTADAMTDPEAFRSLLESDDADIRAALPHAVDRITDPWVALVSPTNDSTPDRPEYQLTVSYELRGLTGGDTIELVLDDGGEPDDVDAWRVTDPLIVDEATYSDLTVALLGGVRVTYPGSSHRGVWGYPGGYVLEPPEPLPDVTPLWVAVGAADAPPWQVSLPVLEHADED